MNELRYPNESREYRDARDALLKDEQELVDKVKAPADRINAWARQRGWSQIALVSGAGASYQADYKCQGDSDDMQLPVLYVFTKRDGQIVHFWGTELPANHVDTAWAYWNLMDFTPEGRPDIDTPPQTFRSEFLEKHYLNRQ